MPATTWFAELVSRLRARSLASCHPAREANWTTKLLIGAERLPAARPLGRMSVPPRSRYGSGPSPLGRAITRTACHSRAPAARTTISTSCFRTVASTPRNVHVLSGQVARSLVTDGALSRTKIPPRRRASPRPGLVESALWKLWRAASCAAGARAPPKNQCAEVTNAERAQAMMALRAPVTSALSGCVPKVLTSWPKACAIETKILLLVVGV